MEKLYVACEFGTRVSRIMLGTLQNHNLRVGELRRFATPVSNDKKVWQWDIPALFQETVTALADLGKQEVNIAGLSCHSWSGDYLLFDADGTLLSPVFHLNDPRSAAGAEAVLE